MAEDVIVIDLTQDQPSVLPTAFPTVAPTLPQAAVVPPAVVVVVVVVVTSPLPAATYTAPPMCCSSWSTQLPASIFSPVSSGNQSGGQVIVNGTGLNLTSMGQVHLMAKTLPNHLCSS